MTLSYSRRERFGEVTLNRLFVGNIPFTKSEDALAEWFNSQGFKTRVVEIIQDRGTSKPRGFGFVELEDDGLAEMAVRSLNGKPFAGRALTISWATPIRQTA
jgi:RNA recognition motif-containing protein